MTIRTLSLLLLFVIAFGISAVLAAAVQPLAVRFGASTPWVIPVSAIVCYSATLFLGRRFILPLAFAHSPARALVMLIAVTGASMGLAYGLVWGMQMLVGGLPAVAGLAVWFGALWTALTVLELSARRRP
jgi:hypothetical protein